jgi:hypothetical protein
MHLLIISIYVVICADYFAMQRCCRVAGEDYAYEKDEREPPPITLYADEMLMRENMVIFMFITAPPLMMPR